MILLNGPDLLDAVSSDRFSRRVPKALRVPAPAEARNARLRTPRTPAEGIITFPVFSHPFFLWPNAWFDLLWPHAERTSSWRSPQRPSALSPQRSQLIPSAVTRMRSSCPGAQPRTWQRRLPSAPEALNFSSAAFSTGLPSCPPLPPRQQLPLRLLSPGY